MGSLQLWEVIGLKYISTIRDQEDQFADNDLVEFFSCENFSN
jgi:hypothetical protein